MQYQELLPGLMNKTNIQSLHDVAWWLVLLLPTETGKGDRAAGIVKEKSK